MTVEMKNVRMDFGQFMMTPPFDMNIQIQKLNFSELLAEDDFLTKEIDFLNFDKSEKITIKSSGF